MITILADVKDIAMTDFGDVRSFVEGEVHELSEANERLLVELGLATPDQPKPMQPLDLAPDKMPTEQKTEPTE